MNLSQTVAANEEKISLLTGSADYAERYYTLAERENPQAHQHGISNFDRLGLSHLALGYLHGLRASGRDCKTAPLPPLPGAKVTPSTAPAPAAASSLNPKSVVTQPKAPAGPKPVDQMSAQEIHAELVKGPKVSPERTHALISRAQLLRYGETLVKPQQ